MSLLHHTDLSFNFAAASVLILDRNSTCQDVLAEILAGFGFRRLHRCAELDVCPDLIKARSLDLILIDPYPYGPQAYEFVRWLRHENLGSNSAAPVIVVTGHTQLQCITAARDCGADFVVAKPFSPAVLLDRILWVAQGDGRRGQLIAPPNLISNDGSGIELW